MRVQLGSGEKGQEAVLDDTPQEPTPNYPFPLDKASTTSQNGGTIWRPRVQDLPLRDVFLFPQEASFPGEEDSSFPG